MNSSPAPRRLYKYLPSCHLDDFVRRGRALFRNLTYFRQYQNDANRGDLFEGRHIDRPRSGVKLSNLRTGQTFEGDYAFINSVKTESIFAFCMSTRHDETLYSAFAADACVEITAPGAFFRDCRRALHSLDRQHNYQFLHGAVVYYHEAKAVLASVKDPTTIPFFKPAVYSAQDEYRILFAAPSSLVLKQRIVYGHALPGIETADDECAENFVLRLRGPRQYMKIHRK